MLKCKITGNECGTDTWTVGQSCPCESCQIYLMTPEDRLQEISTIGQELEQDAKKWHLVGLGGILTECGLDIQEQTTPTFLYSLDAGPIDRYCAKCVDIRQKRNKLSDKK
jgi:hypothetical protein